MIDYQKQIHSANSYAELIQVLKSIPNLDAGRTSFVVTARGDEVETAFKVVEASKLIPSNSLDGRINPLFPQELQPRDRTRQSSVLQVAKMANSLRPAQLADSGLSSHGAPIVGEDMVVESGNGRTMAITKAYIEGKADDYKSYLVKNAAMYGLKADSIEQMHQPVLVRVRRTDVNRADFAKDSNLSDITEMAASEKAWVDAENISKGMMAVFEPSETGNLLARSNQQFVQAFLRSLGDSATAGMLTSDGRPTKQLLDRMQNAIFAKAYKNEKLVKLVAEEADPEIRNVLTALNTAAPDFVEMQYLSGEAHKQASGAVADAVESLDKQALSALVEAAELVRRAKEDGQSVQEAISQLGLFGDVSEQAQQLALFIANNNRSAKRMGDAFKLLAQEINAELRRSGSAMGDMFGDAGASLDDVIRSVERQLDLDIGGGQQSMFESASFAITDTTIQDMATEAIKGVKSWSALIAIMRSLENPNDLKTQMRMALASRYSRYNEPAKYDDIPLLDELFQRTSVAIKESLLNGGEKSSSKIKSIVKELKSVAHGLYPRNTETGEQIISRFLSEIFQQKLNCYLSSSESLKILSKLGSDGVVDIAGLYTKLQSNDLTDEERFKIASKLERLTGAYDGKKKVSSIGMGVLGVISNILGVSVNELYHAGSTYGLKPVELPKSKGIEAMNSAISIGESISHEPITNIVRFPRSQAISESNKIARSKFTKAEDKLVQDCLVDIHSVIGIKPSLLDVISKKTGRAYASSSQGLVAISSEVPNTRQETIWHEVGHHIEFAYPKIKAAAAAFLRKRATGKKVDFLESISGYGHYRGTNEIAVIDDFSNHYTSKVYVNKKDKRAALAVGIEQIELTGTEIISMGMQYLCCELYYPNKKNFGNDTEFRNFMLGIVKMLGDGEFENLGF